MDAVQHFSIPTAICTHDLNLLEANNAFVDLFACENGKSISPLLSQNDLHRLQRKLGRNQQYKLAVRAQNERQTPYELKFKKIDETKIAILATDATEQRKAEEMLASYSQLIERQNKAIQIDKQKLEVLIANILPSSTIAELRRNGTVQPKKFQNVGIIALDFVGFTALSEKTDADLLFSELNEMFTCFDILAERYSCERIKTIGDAYLAVTNVNIENYNSHESLANFAMDALGIIESRKSDLDWQCRIGLHQGDLVAGVVGKTKILFDVFGDGINTAFRVEALSLPMKINCSSQFYETSTFKDNFSPRGLQKVKGKTASKMYFLNKPLSPATPQQLREIIQTAKSTKSIVETNVIEARKTDQPLSHSL